VNSFDMKFRREVKSERDRLMIKQDEENELSSQLFVRYCLSV